VALLLIAQHFEIAAGQPAKGCCGGDEGRSPGRVGSIRWWSSRGRGPAGHCCRRFHASLNAGLGSRMAARPATGGV
jgi:hypothetical protein